MYCDFKIAVSVKKMKKKMWERQELWKEKENAMCEEVKKTERIQRKKNVQITGRKMQNMNIKRKS